MFPSPASGAEPSPLAPPALLPSDSFLQSPSPGPAASPLGPPPLVPATRRNLLEDYISQKEAFRYTNYKTRKMLDMMEIFSRGLPTPDAQNPVKAYTDMKAAAQQYASAPYQRLGVPLPAGAKAEDSSMMLSVASGDMGAGAMNRHGSGVNEASIGAAGQGGQGTGGVGSVQDQQQMQLQQMLLGGVVSSQPVSAATAAANGSQGNPSSGAYFPTPSALPSVFPSSAGAKPIVSAASNTPPAAVGSTVAAAKPPMTSVVQSSPATVGPVAATNAGSAAGTGKSKKRKESKVTSASAATAKNTKRKTNPKGKNAGGAPSVAATAAPPAAAGTVASTVQPPAVSSSALPIPSMSSTTVGSTYSQDLGQTPLGQSLGQPDMFQRLLSQVAGSPQVQPLSAPSAGVQPSTASFLSALTGSGSSNPMMPRLESNTSAQPSTIPAELLDGLGIGDSSLNAPPFSQARNPMQHQVSHQKSSQFPQAAQSTNPSASSSQLSTSDLLSRLSSGMPTSVQSQQPVSQHQQKPPFSMASSPGIRGLGAMLDSPFSQGSSGRPQVSSAFPPIPGTSTQTRDLLSQLSESTSQPQMPAPPASTGSAPLSLKLNEAALLASLLNETAPPTASSSRMPQPSTSLSPFPAAASTNSDVSSIGGAGRQPPPNPTLQSLFQEVSGSSSAGSSAFPFAQASNPMAAQQSLPASALSDFDTLRLSGIGSPLADTQSQRTSAPALSAAPAPERTGQPAPVNNFNAQAMQRLQQMLQGGK